MNGFERHGVGHLSATALNLWIAAPSLYVMERILHRKGGGVGAAAHRGTASETGVSAGLFDLSLSYADCISPALAQYDKLTALSGDSRREQERDAVPGIVEVALKELRPYGMPTPPEGSDPQHKIETRIEGVSVPFIGWLDFMWDKHAIIVDLKSQLRLNSEISEPHKRQFAIYQHAKSNHDVRVCYATPKKCGVYRLEREGYEAAIKTVVAAAQRLERFLSVSGDPEELAAIVPHDPSTFYFNDARTKAVASQVFGY